MNDIIKQRTALQQAMTFAPALSCGIEELLGRSANSMTYVAGRKLGRQLTEGARRTDDILEALDVARLDPLIVAAVADVRGITINQVREFKAAIEGKRGQATAPGRREARERVLDLARELSEETPKRPAQEVFTALMAAALEEATRKRGRRPSTLATIHAKRSGRVAVRARRSSNGTLVLELPGNSGASMEEVKEGISRLAEEHYRSADSASEG